MLDTTSPAAGHRRRWRDRAPRVVGAVGTLTVAAVVALALPGCFAQATSAASPIQIATAYVPAPHGGNTVAYVVIRNNGATDSLVSARTSAGGRVTFHHAPAGPSDPGTLAMSSVPVPGHGTLKMAPNGYYMVISGARPLHSGTAITLTLDFARAGPVSVVAQITNPETGGKSDFLN